MTNVGCLAAAIARKEQEMDVTAQPLIRLEGVTKVFHAR